MFRKTSEFANSVDFLERSCAENRTNMTFTLRFEENRVPRGLGGARLL